jgi:hypothetical protein
LTFWIITNDEYEMTSIDKLHWMFLAGRSYNKWHRLNVEHVTAKGSKSFASFKYVVHWKPEDT